MKLAGVIGDPIDHSRSPLLHRFWLERYEIEGAYLPLHVRPDDLAEVVRALPRMGFAGANVTLPHKQAALDLADQVTPTARDIGAANTLYFDAGKIIADNTDAYGFLANLDCGVPDWPADRPALVFGAGGAARAVLHGLKTRGCPKIHVVNRSREKADALARHFGARVEVLGDAEIPCVLPRIGTLVNTTSLGMSGMPPLPVDLTGLNAEAVVNDIVYTPLKTPLLAQAEDRGLRYVDGLGMLLHQAAPGFEAWFGRRPEVTVELRAAVLK